MSTKKASSCKKTQSHVDMYHFSTKINNRSQVPSSNRVQNDDFILIII